MASDIVSLVREIKSAGLLVDEAKKRLLVRTPGGLVISSIPKGNAGSKHRHLLDNVRAQCRRAGFPLNGDAKSPKSQAAKTTAPTVPVQQALPIEVKSAPAVKPEASKPKPEEPPDRFTLRAKAKAKAKSHLAIHDARRVTRLRVAHEDLVDPSRKLTFPADTLDFEHFGIYTPEEAAKAGQLASEGYQREEIKWWVNDLSDVLRRGGYCAPGNVSRRMWNKADKRLWIVDGQQRFWAHVDAHKPWKAYLHETNSIEEESLLFDILNNRKGLNANLIISNHDGAAVVKVLRPMNEDPGSTLFERILFTKGHATRKINAATALRCLTLLVSKSSGQGSGGDVRSQLTRVDARCAAGDVEKFKSFLWAVGAIFYLPPPGTNPTTEHFAAFSASWRAWGEKSATNSQIKRLRTVALKLHSVVGATSSDRIHMMRRRFAKVLPPQNEADA